MSGGGPWAGAGENGTPVPWAVTPAATPAGPPPVAQPPATPPPAASPWNPAPSPQATPAATGPVPSEPLAPWVQPQAAPWAPGAASSGARPPAQRSGTWLWAGGLVAVLALGGGGYLLVDGLTSHSSTDSTTGGAADAPSFGAPAPAPSGGGESSDSSAAPQPSGEEVDLQPVSVTATCQAEAGVDSAGNPVTYEPQRTLDGRPDTAWRCEGAAIGARLVYEFAEPVTITEVGLIPGYAKIDPTDGTDRFLDNFTVTGVEWRFDDGETHVQRIPAPQPALATSEVTENSTSTRVTLEITATGNPGAEREFTAISDVAFRGYPAGTR